MKMQIRWSLGVVLLTFALSALSAPATPQAPSLNSGYAVVEDLKARFADTSRECSGGGPGLNCNGVLVRAISRWEDPRFWNPTADYIKRNAISFSYLRKDMGTVRLTGTQGMIMYPVGKASKYVLSVRCVFPFDGFTLYRDDGCGTYDFPKACPEHGINDIPGWLAHAAQTGDGFFCYLEPTAQWFQFSIDIRGHYDEIDRGRWDEIVVAAWPEDIPEQLPIQALFYSDGALANAQKLQQSFFAETGHFLPIIRLALTEAEIFSYAPEDQTTVPIQK